MHSTIKVDSPLGPDAFTLRTMNAHDELGRLFDYELELLATDPEVNPRDLLGRDMTVSIGLPDGERHFNGYVTSLTYRGRSGRNGVYRLRLNPWLWFLTRTANCRIFQNKSVPDIIAQVFQQRGFGNVEESLSGSYRTWEYLVQYRETDFQFVTRLMELEGIYYYFRHDAGKHSLVLADGHGAHDTVSGYAELPYYEASQGARREREHIRHWNVVQSVQPGSYVLDNYDFKRPRAVLQVSTSAGHAHEHDDYEVYDYPGPYEQTNDGEDYARVKLESLHASFERIHASTDARGLACGALFSLTDHPSDDQNTEYLVVSADYALHGSDDRNAAENSFEVTFQAMRSSKPFRLASITPKPVVHGPQTAKVVGRSGEEIYTDEYGRVKVQFPWDREGGSDENSSCWVRVSQVMAGNSWGAMHVPRIGQEVVVSFLEGDPDRPLITGRVYNGNNMPPFGLPGKGMVSGIKTDSTKGGGGYNEISLDDTKGKEKVVIHGQYDMETTIEHDQMLLVHNDRGATIDANDSESVGKNQTINIGADQSITVKASQDLTIGSNQFVNVAINAAETVGAAKELTVGGAYAVTVGAALRETVTGSKAESIGGSRSISVGGTSGEDVKGAKTTTSAKSISLTAKEAMNLSADKKMALTSKEDFAIASQKKGVFEFADELSIKVGSAELTLKKNGDITIKGKKITIDGSGDVVLKGSKVTAN